MLDLFADPRFNAVRDFADLMILHGRDRYGPRHSPLFAAQLNADTRQIPAGTSSSGDPGLWLEDREIIGYQPSSQNLASDFSLLDVLQTLTRLTGEGRYEQARVDYLAAVLRDCRHPESGYLPWGEHVGFDIVRDEIRGGSYKGWHEIKAYDVPWQQLWDVDPAGTRHEIEVALRDHICDDSTFAFNRHTTMDGKGNRGKEPCSLVSSAGVYVNAWCWMHRKTGEEKFLDWAMRLNAQVRSRRSGVTGLLGTDDKPRRRETWYLDGPVYARFLLRAAAVLDERGDTLRREAQDYLFAYDRHGYDPAARAYYGTLDTETARPVKGRPVHLEAWKLVSNALHLVTLLSASAEMYVETRDPRAREMFDRVLACIDIPGHVTRNTPMPATDVAAAIFALLAMARATREDALLRQAEVLVDHAMRNHRRNGLFTSGLVDGGGGERYYCARAGSAALAAAVLACAMTRAGLGESAPRCRDVVSGLRN
jgi:hypothetical protein